MRQIVESEETAAALEIQRAYFMAALRRAVPELSRSLRFEIEEFLMRRLFTIQERVKFRTLIEQAPKADNPAGYVRRAFEMFRAEHGSAR